MEPWALDPVSGNLVLTIQAFLVRTRHHTILIDTCVGDHKPRPQRPFWHMLKLNTFLPRLAAAGVAPEDVDYVMCTHLHWDHVGWNTRRVDGQWVPTFPNAQYVMAKREYDHWNAVYAREKGNPANPHVLAFEDSVEPVMRAEKALLVKDDFELDRGISLAPCPGHTPGHVVVNVASGGKRGVFVGDAIHHPMQIMFPDLSTRADIDQDMARVSRRKLIDAHAGTGNLVMPHHFATPTSGTIEQAGNGFRFNFIEES
jgi:glyoxylase-like metal-dependent hydrolase (beta-lactamase superfamily II)